MIVLAKSSGLRFQPPGGRNILYPGFTISAGERVQLKGPSGSGKSTLFRLLAGLEHPDGGQLLLNAKRIGYAFQEPRLIPKLSAVENILIACRADRSEVETNLKTFDLDAVANQPSEKLSGGEAQRVNLVRALMCKPDLLLIDEAATGLDPDSWGKAQAGVADLIANKNVAVVEIAHAPAIPIAAANATQEIRLNAL